jgi:hypothetical protein
MCAWIPYVLMYLFKRRTLVGTNWLCLGIQLIGPCHGPAGTLEVSPKPHKGRLTVEHRKILAKLDHLLAQYCLQVIVPRARQLSGALWITLAAVAEHWERCKEDDWR